MPRFLHLLFFALLTLAALPAQAAEPATHDFDVRLRGVTVGTVRLDLMRQAGRYEARARIESAGLVSVLRPFSYSGTAVGADAGGRLVPARFEERADTGRRRSEAVLAYDGGAPRVIRYASSLPAAPDRPEPASQRDAVDPVTALAELLRDRPGDGVCGKSVTLFDGMRRSRVTLGEARREAGAVSCTGEYRRLQGFTPRELKRHVAFPLRVALTPAGGGLMRVARIEVASSYGLVTLDRP